MLVAGEIDPSVPAGVSVRMNSNAGENSSVVDGGELDQSEPGIWQCLVKLIET